MPTKKWAILLVVFVTLLTSLGQIFWKFGSYHINANILSWLNPPLVLGFLSYGLGAVLLIIALKHGELSTLYPIVATSYIWVALISPLFFPDTFTFSKFIGIAVIILGVALITRGDKHD